MTITAQKTDTTEPEAAKPKRKFDAGLMIPGIDPMRCEAAGPYNALAIRTVSAEAKSRLPLLGRFKLFVHEGMQAFVENPDACNGCGLCVQACPEKAMELKKAVSTSTREIPI